MVYANSSSRAGTIFRWTSNVNADRNRPSARTLGKRTNSIAGARQMLQSLFVCGDLSAEVVGAGLVGGICDGVVWGRKCVEDNFLTQLMIDIKD